MFEWGAGSFFIASLQQLWKIGVWIAKQVGTSRKSGQDGIIFEEDTYSVDIKSDLSGVVTRRTRIRGSSWRGNSVRISVLEEKILFRSDVPVLGPAKETLRGDVRGIPFLPLRFGDELRLGQTDHEIRPGARIEREVSVAYPHLSPASESTTSEQPDDPYWELHVHHDVEVKTQALAFHVHVAEGLSLPHCTATSSIIHPWVESMGGEPAPTVEREQRKIHWERSKPSVARRYTLVLQFGGEYPGSARPTTPAEPAAPEIAEAEAERQVAAERAKGILDLLGTVDVRFSARFKQPLFPYVPVDAAKVLARWPRSEDGFDAAILGLTVYLEAMRVPDKGTKQKRIPISTILGELERFLEDKLEEDRRDGIARVIGRFQQFRQLRNAVAHRDRQEKIRALAPYGLDPMTADDQWGGCWAVILSHWQNLWYDFAEVLRK